MTKPPPKIWAVQSVGAPTTERSTRSADGVSIEMSKLTLVPGATETAG